jgi:hypothetical protein
MRFVEQNQGFKMARSKRSVKSFFHHWARYQRRYSVPMTALFYSNSGLVGATSAVILNHLGLICGAQYMYTLRWRQDDLPKRWYLNTSLDAVTTQNTAT